MDFTAINEERQRLERVRQEYLDGLALRRLRCWASTGACLSIGGVDVSPLSARTYADLTIAGNRLMTGGDLRAGDLFGYIWRHCADYAPAARLGWRGRFRRWRLMRKLARMPWPVLLEGCAAHRDDAFEDSAGDARATPCYRSSPPVPMVVSQVEAAAARYGADPQAVADWPLRVVMQLARCHNLRTVPGFIAQKPDGLKAAEASILELEDLRTQLVREAMGGLN